VAKTRDNGQIVGAFAFIYTIRKVSLIMILQPLIDLSFAPCPKSGTAADSRFAITTLLCHNRFCWVAGTVRRLANENESRYISRVFSELVSR